MVTILARTCSLGAENVLPFGKIAACSSFDSHGMTSDTCACQRECLKVTQVWQNACQRRSSCECNELVVARQCWSNALTLQLVSCARYAARRSGFMAVPVCHGTDAVVTTQTWQEADVYGHLCVCLYSCTICHGRLTTVASSVLAVGSPFRGLPQHMSVRTCRPAGSVRRLSIRSLDDTRFI
jgi:hypothetical protein